MRADGSIKSLTTGVSTLDESRTTTMFMRACQNFRNDPIDGLQRRPPARIVKLALCDDYRAGIDAIVPFELDNAKYWIMLRPGMGALGATEARIWDEDGTEETVRSDSLYFNTLRGAEDIELVADGDVLYLVNKEVQPAMSEATDPILIESSALYVKKPLPVGSRMDVYCSNDNIDTLTHAWIQSSGNGTYNDITDIANALQTALDTDAGVGRFAVTYHTNTLVIRKTSGFEEAANLGWFADLQVSCSAGEDYVQAINGSVQYIEDLPRFFHDKALISVLGDPTSDEDDFYMRATRMRQDYIPDIEGATDGIVLRSGKVTTTRGKAFSGYNHYNATPYFGSFPDANNLAPWGYPNHYFLVLQIGTDNPAPVDGGQSQLLAWVLGPANSPLPAEALRYVECWQETNLSYTKRWNIHMERVSVADYAIWQGGYVSSAVFEGTIDFITAFAQDITYKLFNDDQHELVGSPNFVGEVLWVEESAPRQATSINGHTMPHALVKQDDGIWDLQTVNSMNDDRVQPMIRRTSGNNVNNPKPGFIGSNITDIGIHQSRLVLLSENKIAMSQTRMPTNWWRSTVTQLLATDPIYIEATAAKSEGLRHFVPHNKDLFIWGPSGQFKLDGTVGLTPQNAAVQKTSSFDCSVDAVPVGLGNFVIYPSSYGWSAGLNAYSLSADIDNMYTSRALSDHAIGLHLGKTEKIVAMSNAGMILQKCILDDQLYVMEWYKEPGTPIGGDVPSWSNWYFQWGTKILDMRERGNHWVDMVVTAPAGGPAQDVGKVHLVRMDMQNNRQFYQEYGDVHLDLRGFTTSNGVNLSLPEDYPEHTGPDGLDNLVIVEKATGRTVPYTRSGRTYQFGFEPKDGQVYFGYPFESAVVLPSVVTRDESNVVQTQANMRISRYEVTLTGHAQATFSYKWGGFGQVYDWQARKLNSAMGDLEGLEDRWGFRTNVVSVRRNTWQIPMREKAGHTNLWLATDSPVMMNVHQIEWEGTYIKKGRRF